MFRYKVVAYWVKFWHMSTSAATWHLSDYLLFSSICALKFPTCYIVPCHSPKEHFLLINAKKTHSQHTEGNPPSVCHSSICNISNSKEGFRTFPVLLRYIHLGFFHFKPEQSYASMYLHWFSKIPSVISCQIQQAIFFHEAQFHEKTKQSY